MDSVAINGKEVPVERIDVGTRTASARLREGTIVIRLPSRMPRQNREKVYEKLKQMLARRLAKLPPHRLENRSIEFAHGKTIRIFNNEFIVNIIEGDFAYSHAKASGNFLNISLRNNIDEESKNRAINLLARKALTRFVQPLVVQRTEQLNREHFNFRLNSVKVRNQKSKWGSCSKRGKNINISFRLMFAPQEIIDSVILHELAHLKECNHSRRFWELLKSADQHCKEHDKWLDKYGDDLGIVDAWNFTIAGQTKAAVLPESDAQSSDITKSSATHQALQLSRL